MAESKVQEPAEEHAEVKEIISLFDNINDATKEDRPGGALMQFIKNPLMLVGTGVTVFFLGKAFSAGSGGRNRDLSSAFKGRIMAQFVTIGAICGAFYFIMWRQSPQQRDPKLDLSKTAWDIYNAKSKHEDA